MKVFREELRVDGGVFTAHSLLQIVMSKTLTAKGHILFKLYLSKSSQTLIQAFFPAAINRYAFRLSLRSCNSTLPATLK